MTDAWYAYDGPENDVALSTRIRFARNLANYPFPQSFRGEDASRVQTLVFDAVSHSSFADDYQALPVSALDSLGAQILTERGVISEATVKAPHGGIVMRNDGKLCCTVNDTDHVHIISFLPGLACTPAFDECRQLDDVMQQSLQFAASYDFGFLTSSLRDSGSGMRISVRVHLPALSLAGRIGEFVEAFAKKGIDLAACYGSGSEAGSSLGSYYQVALRCAGSGSELDQIALVVSAVEKLVGQERKTRAKLAKERTTEILDTVYRAYARARFALLMPLREAVETISSLKFGKDVGFITGIDYATLHALLYRVQEGHLQFVLKSGSFTFAKDIAGDTRRQTERLRALILQEACENTICKGSQA